MSYRTIKFSSFTIIILFVITCSTNPEEGACGDGYFIDSGVNRISDIESRVQKDIDPDMNVGIFLTYGQSNSENYGELGYTVTNDIFQFYNDSTYLYADPSLGGTGHGGSVWGMVGDKLVDNGNFNQVVFAVAGWGGKTISELSNGDYYDYFIGNYCQLTNRFGKIDGILFHQGESDSWIGNYDYYNDFKKFYQKMNDSGVESPFYLSLASFCNSQVDSNLLSIQNQIIIDYENVLRGPNTDLLIDPQYRLSDNCHFSLIGLQEFSDMWIESITNKSEL